MTQAVTLSGLGSTNALYTDSSGNVGIGTSSPRASKLDVLSATGTQNTTADSPGLVNITGPTGPTSAQPLFVLGVNDALAANIGPAITFQARYLTSSTAAANIAYIAAIRENATSGNVQGAIIFNPRNAAGNFPEAMRIDSSGRVTRPFQTAFHGYLTTNTASGIQTGYTASLNVGNNFSASTGRFTAPVTGTYMFAFSTLGTPSGQSSDIYLFINGAKRSEVMSVRPCGTNTSQPYTPLASNTGLVALSVGDYVEISASVGLYSDANIWQHFSGYLI